MSREKCLKISRYIFLAVIFILTVLFFFDIKFVIMGINILVLDVLVAGIWIFVRLCKWAGRENTEKRTVAVIGITLVGLFAAASLMFILAMRGELSGYIEGTEPQTHRTFVVEYTQNIMGRGRAKLYERVGPLLFACDVDEYIGEFSVERPEDQRIYISKDGESIVVAYFFLMPIFIIPLEEPVEAEITPEQALTEQLIEITPEQALAEPFIHVKATSQGQAGLTLATAHGVKYPAACCAANLMPRQLAAGYLTDDTHDAFLVDTKGKLGTLLVTAELAMESKNEFGTRDITFSV